MNDEPTGDCFSAAFNYLFNVAPESHDPTIFSLVHGNIAHLPQETPVNHAWVEEGEVVHEVSNGSKKTFQRSLYYELLKITNTKRYSMLQAISLGAVHTGPWDDGEIADECTDS